MRYVTFHKSASKLGPIYIYILCVLLETAGQTKGVLIAAYTLEPRDKYKSTTYSTAKGSPVAWYSGRVFALTKKNHGLFYGPEADQRSHPGADHRGLGPRQPSSET